MRRKKIVFVIIIATLFSTSLIQAQSINQAGYFFTLTILVSPGDAFTYGMYIVNYLREINIDAKIKVFSYDCDVPDPFPKIYTDWDLAICSFKGGGRTPDLRYLYTEEGSQNIFNLNSDIPNQTESENMQNEAVTITDFNEKQQLYYDWQELVMNQIVPILPLFSPRLINAYWANFLGFDIRWGLSDSSPYMSISGYHEGQESIHEMNVAHNDFGEKIRESIFDNFSFLQWELISEPIIQWSPYNIPLETGLVHYWVDYENSHYSFNMRDDIYWNPSFNITERDSSSNPLVSESSPGVWEITDPSILMEGLKAGEKSDGLSQKVTAKDAVFTLLTAANPMVSQVSDDYRWLSDCYVDPSDSHVFHIFVDDNPETTEIEHNANALSFLDLGILPEFFLNSTDNTMTYTSGGAKCIGLNETTKNTVQWINYEKNPFGSGKYMLDYYNDNPSIVLTRSPFWFGVGAIDGVGGKTPFVETVNIYDIPNEEKRREIFETGKLDLISVTSFPRKKNMQAEPRFEIEAQIRNIFNLIAFNLEREFIGGSSNKKWIVGPDGNNYTEACAVRKAICYAIDRKEMNEEIHDGEYTISNNPIYLYTAYYYNDDVTKYNRSIISSWRWFDSTRRYKVGINTPHSSTIAVLCLILTSKFIYRKKLRKRR